MANKNSGSNKFYIISIFVMIFVLPVLSFSIEELVSKNEINDLASIGKWFIFYTAGIRLFIAGIKQITNPAFTAKAIFHFTGTESFAIIKELGFANVCAGLVGIISLFIPAWRIVSAFSSGLYYGFAGFGHLAKKSASTNERFALITDIIVFVLFVCYVIIFSNSQFIIHNS